MNYAEKIQYSETVKTYLLQGDSLGAITSLATEFGIVPYQLEKVVDLALREFYNEQQSDIQAYLLNNDKFPPDSDWLKLDDSVQDAMLEMGKKDLVQDEINHVQDLLQENYTQEEILEEVRLNIYPEEKVLRQVQKYQAEEEKKQKQKRLWFFSGLLWTGLLLITSLKFGFGVIHILMLGSASISFYRSK
ncbi:MAG: hypothetical protein K9I85_12045 [Saprospiraceae bacterium]|nr:hypothetical protein [Saprospiraceae bacterium]